MMSLVDLDDEQRWVPTHVNVTVLRARGLRTRGKHGSRYLYATIQAGKEKHTTGLVEKAAVPEWNEECCFELLPGILEDDGRSAQPPGSGRLVLTVMHRVLIGLDVFLGQTVIPLEKIFQDGRCPRDEWFKLNSKAGRKEKERGELQVTVQFTRNNMTASMFDLTIKDKPRSALGKLKDRVTGRKRGDVESSSAIVPGRYAALSGSAGQLFGEDGREATESPDVEMAEEKRSKVKDFFKGRLSKSSDTRSCSSLASDSSVFSMASDGPPPSLDLLSDPPSSPIYTSKVRVDTHGETDLAKKVLTSQHTTRVRTHKRAFSDEASKVTTALSRVNPAVESLKGQTMTQSKSSLCINGSHVYDSEPSAPKTSAAHPAKQVLLEKRSPHSRSLQNVTKRSEDRGAFADGRRWSFDKAGREENEVEKDAHTSPLPSQQAEAGGRPLQAVIADVSTANLSDKGKKPRKSLFSGGRSDSLPAKSDMSQAPSTSEGRFRGWFGSGDSQNKPRLEVTPKVESSSDLLPPLPPRSPVSPQCSSPPASPSSHASPVDCNRPNPFMTPNSSTSISPSNPFPSCAQHSPVFEELVAEELQMSPPFATCSPSASSPFHYTSLPSEHCTLGPVRDASAVNMAYRKRERPRPLPRQISLPAMLPKAALPSFTNDSAPQSVSERAGEWDDSFDAFASSRLNSPKGSLPQNQRRTSPISSPVHSYRTVDTNNDAQKQETHDEEPPTWPPRRLLRTPVNELFSDGWLHRGQELAVHKEACLLSQTGVASRLHGREGECKRNRVSPDPHTSSEASDTLSVNSQPMISSQGVLSEEKLKKFKYEPLEDGTDCWGGMLFEQDLYGRVCGGNYGQPKADSHHLSVNAEEMSRNKIPSMNSGPKIDHNSEISFSELLNLFPTAPSKPDARVLDVTSAPIDEGESNPPETTCINNNETFSRTLGDLNMNVSHSDFNFIHSDGSSQPGVVDTLKSTNPFGRTFPKSLDDPPIAASYKAETVTTPQDVFTLKDTYIRDMNSSFELTALSNKWRRVSAVCQDHGQDCRCEVNNTAPCCYYGVNDKEMAANPVDLKSRGDISILGDSKKTQRDFDDNGNADGKIGTHEQMRAFSNVVSARLRPKGLSRQNSSGSSSNTSRSGDREFEHLLSLVQNISGVSEGTFSYQPTKSALSTLLAFNKQADSQGDGANSESDSASQLSSEVGTTLRLKENCITAKSSQVSFEDLHAKVAPISRTPSDTGRSLQELEPPSPSIPCALPPSTVSSLHPNPLCCPRIHPASTEPSTQASVTLAVATCTSSSSYSTTSTTSSSDQPLVDARHSLLPEETHPASNLPHQESRSHPVKPLASSQSERKEGRSVLEKLKSTLHPGRASQQVAGEPERSQEVTADRLAQYQHLTNMELISLLLQQEMDMQKQGAASERQEAQLHKFEAELRKVKLQVRDLEDYIDNLLLRIMEQTPTLLQVHTRHK